MKTRTKIGLAILGGPAVVVGAVVGGLSAVAEYDFAVQNGASRGEAVLVPIQDAIERLLLTGVSLTAWLKRQQAMQSDYLREWYYYKNVVEPTLPQ